MTTPLYDAMQSYLQSKPARFHTPGHKGSLPFPLAELAPYDLTELPLTGSLFDEEGPMLDTESRIASFYGAGASLISAGGATLCIQGMLGAFCPMGSKLLMFRGCHRSAVSAAALLGLEIIWVYPDLPSGAGLPGTVSPKAVADAIHRHPDARGLYVTSPDYFGVLQDIAAFQSICAQHGIPLLVDNAHGSHLRFFEELHPLVLGADACCDSFHKTLPVLTGGAVLHLKDSALRPKARAMMALFGSTSPSYPIMLSIELAAARLEELKAHYQALAIEVGKLRQYALDANVWGVAATADPLRIVLDYSQSGLDQSSFTALCQHLGIEPEYTTATHTVLLPAPLSPLDGVYRLIDRIRASVPASPYLNPLPILDQKLPLRDAILKDSEPIDIQDSVGRIAAQIFAPCPPGVPITVPGEQICEKAKVFLKNYGAKQIYVVKCI